MSIVELNENIVPKELVVGISGNLCYVTYYEQKGKKKTLNSEKSWTDWSNNSNSPLIIENKFSNGFKLAGTNGRWSSNAQNAENMLIEHPLFNKSFEISIARFTEIASKCNIIKGVFDIDLIMTKTRDIVTVEEYTKMNKINVEAQNKQKLLDDKNKSNAVKGKDQIPGTVYINRKNNQRTLYLGEVRDKSWDKPRHVYCEESSYSDDGKFNSSFTTFTGLHGDMFKERTEVTKTAPSILRVDYWRDEWNESILWNLSIVASKKPMSYTKSKSVDNPEDSIYKNYTEDDWKKIYSIYKKFDSYDKSYFHGTKNEPQLNWEN